MALILYHNCHAEAIIKLSTGHYILKILLRHIVDFIGLQKENRLFCTFTVKLELISGDPVSEIGQYADLEAISKFETPYVGDTSMVGGIISNLPRWSDFYDQNFFSLNTEQSPYGLTVYYEYNDNDDGKMNPFTTSDAENNALILFAYIGNLNDVTFSYRNTASNGVLEPSEYTPRYSYTRSDIYQKFGDVAKLKGDLPKFYKLLDDNLLIDTGSRECNSRPVCYFFT